MQVVVYQCGKVALFIILRTRSVQV